MMTKGRLKKRIVQYVEEAKGCKESDLHVAIPELSLAYGNDEASAKVPDVKALVDELVGEGELSEMVYELPMPREYTYPLIRRFLAPKGTTWVWSLFRGR